MKTIVITGSTRGIGFGLARELLQRGSRVVVNGRTPAAADAAVSALSAQAADRVWGCAADVTDYDQVQRLWDQSLDHFGRIDIWINNAGLAHPDVPFWELPKSEVDRVVSVNLIGLMYGCRVAINGLLAQGGGFIYNMYGFGSTGHIRPGMSIYGATKRAVNYLTEALVVELKDRPVKVAAISPGMVITDLVTDQYTDRPQDFQRARDAFNLLGDRVETVTPWLADRVLGNDQSGADIRWLTGRKLVGRLIAARFRKRDLFAAPADGQERRNGA